MTEITPPAPDEPTGENQNAEATSPPPPPPPPPPAAPSAPIYGEGAPAAGATRPAELVDRFVARLIDGVLLMVVIGVIVVPLTIGMLFTGSDFLGGVISAVVVAVIYLGYYGYMESSRGQTVGKMVMKLRVLGPNGGNPTMEEAVKRNIWNGFGVLGIIPVIGSVVGGVAQLAAAIMIAVGINNDTVNRQAWHDQFAGGTRVVKEG